MTTRAAQHGAESKESHVGKLLTIPTGISLDSVLNTPPSTQEARYYLGGSLRSRSGKYRRNVFQLLKRIKFAPIQREKECKSNIP